jgi:glycosyltransferase involved in cell wall biosynthesis
MRHWKIDILHTSEFRSNMMALLCRRQYPVMLVTTVHGWIANDLRGRIFRVIDKLLLPRFDAVITVSNATRKLVPGWWLRDKRVHVIWNALPLDSYGRHVADSARPARDVARGCVLLNVGRLSPEKGHDNLLQAVAALSGQFPALKLRLAGIGPMEHPLRQLAKSLGIEDRVEFLSYVSDMPKLYGEADLVVQSSLTEGMPNVILEAAYLQLPILATDVGGTAEIVEHGTGAWLIAPGSVKAIESGIRNFLEQPEVFRRRCDEAQRRILQHFSFSARTKTLTNLYESLTERRN